MTCVACVICVGVCIVGVLVDSVVLLLVVIELMVHHCDGNLCICKLQKQTVL